ncbi:hypothetical protein [Trichothermofontia sp.]
MKRLKAVELFLAIGLVTAVGACGSSPTSTSESSPREVSPSPTMQAHGGEGGEGGEGGASGNPDVDYLTTLGLMQGHLLVAKELMDAGQYEQAEPHIGHPVEELYGNIEGQLAARQVPDFKPVLTQLHDLAKTAPGSPEMAKAYEEAIPTLDRAIAALPASERQSPDLVLDTINQMLKTAAEEYKAAIADNKIVEVVEYQDSRGFVLYAEQMYQAITPQMSQARAADHQAITAAFTELKTAWPSIEPPATPVKMPSEVYGLIATIELHS